MKCIKCQSEKNVSGRIFNQIDYVAPAAYYRPNGLRPFALMDVNIRIKNIFYSCCECGCIWAELDNEKLNKVIKEKGTENIKKKLDV